MSAPYQFTFSTPEAVLAQFTLAEGDYVIGRDDSCQVVIELEGMRPRHARLHVTDQVVVEDLESGAGTFIAGVPLKQPVELRAGDPVTFGTCAGSLRLERAPLPPLPARPALPRRRRKVRAAALIPRKQDPPPPGHHPGWEIWAPLPKSESPAPEPTVPSPEERLRELETELDRVRAEKSALEEAAEKARASERDNSSLLKVANRALIKKLSHATGPADERATLRRELKQREQALVEAWAGRQAADERNSQLARRLERVQAGDGEAAPARTNLPTWLVWSFFVSLVALAGLGLAWRSTDRRAQAAEAVITRVRSTAPQFYTEARSLILEGDFNQAQGKIDCALALDPGQAAYHFERGCLAESLLDLPAAIASFEAALALGPDSPEAVATKNLDLCRKLLASRRGAQSAESQYALHQIMLESGRLPEALRMAQRLPDDRALLFRTWAAILEAAGLQGHLTMNEEGSFDLDLRSQSRVELGLLRGLPLRRLILAKSNVSDLTALRGAAIRQLDLSGNPVRDLSALTGSVLETLNLADTEVSNLFPLAGLPLTELVLDRTPVSDLSPLRGMRLQTLRAAGTAVWNLQALSESPLQMLDLSHTRVSDVGPLRHLPIGELNLEGTAVTDLQALEGAPLRVLNAARTPLRSVASLARLPLRELLLGGCGQLGGIEPLAGLRELERLSLPPHLKQVSFLKALPKLRFLAYETEPNPAAGNQTAQDFWLSLAGR